MEQAAEEPKFKRLEARLDKLKSMYKEKYN